MTKRYPASSLARAEIVLAIGGAVILACACGVSLAGTIVALMAQGFSWMAPVFLFVPVALIAGSAAGVYVLLRTPIEIAIFENDTLLVRGIATRWEMRVADVVAVGRSALGPALIAMRHRTGTIHVVRGTIDNFAFLLTDLKTLSPAIEMADPAVARR